MTPNFLRSIKLSFGIWLLVQSAGPSMAQNAAYSEACAPYFSAVRETVPGSVPVVPPTLMGNLEIALPCLVKIIESLNSNADLAAFKSDTRAQFLSATGALRSVISKAIADDKVATDAGRPENAKNLQQFITAFRSLDNTKVARVLAYGTRADDPNVRSNALLVFANVVDNRTVCVAIDHLYDEKIGATPSGIKGRANLLAIVSVVAPWAYFENYANIGQMLDFVSPTIRDDPALKGTNDIVANVRERMALQTERTNKSVCLPESENHCYSYKQEWQTSKIRYPKPFPGCAGR